MIASNLFGTAWLRQCAAMLLVLSLLGCATNPATTNRSSQTQLGVVENYLAALNHRDILMLTAYVTPDFEWLSMVNGERVVEVASREALASMLVTFFEQNQTMRWSVQRASELNDTLAVVEKSEWREGDVTRSRNSLGVYELHDGRIRRVTYFLNQQ